MIGINGLKRWVHKDFVYNPSLTHNEDIIHRISHLSNVEKLIFEHPTSTRYKFLSENEFKEFVNFMINPKTDYKNDCYEIIKLNEQFNDYLKSSYPFMDHD
jgi:hypothetical protein